MKRLLVASTMAAGLALASCSSGSTSPGAAQQPSTPPATGAAATRFLDSHGLSGMSATQIVDKLDASEADRGAGPLGSVRPGELILSDATSGQQVSLPMPKDKFYLAMAPYTQMTHECFNHNTSTCKGELVGETFHASIVDGAGKTVVDQDVKAYDNGFGSIWVPRGLDGTLTITYEDKKVTVPVGTKDDDPTCLTTPLKLT